MRIFFFKKKAEGFYQLAYTRSEARQELLATLMM